MTVPTAYALVSVSYSGRAREMALSVLGMGIASGSALGMIGKTWCLQDVVKY